MIKNVKVIPGCISCRTCETVCPTVFKVDPKSKVITDRFIWRESEILQAEAMCPVNVIKVDSDGPKITFKEAILQNTTWLTRDILELKFSTNWFQAVPGQYISVRLQNAYGEFSRSYSLANYGEDFFTLTVKILKKWRWSRALCKLKPGSSIQYFWALWAFTLKDTLQTKVCVATWTGFAPMLPILKHAQPDARKILIFWARYEEDIYYLEELSDIQNLEIILKVSRPNKEYLNNKWRVTDELDVIPDNAEVYICWNPLMVEEVCSTLSEERFHSRWIQTFKEAFTLSSNYKGKFHHHIIEGNLPYLKQVSWFIILFSLLWVVPSWFYMQSQEALFSSFGPIDNFMWFLYDLSWFAVFFVMIIRPLADIFPNIWILRTLRYFRKSLWVLSASIIVVNWLGMWYFNPINIERYLMWIRWELWYPIIARLSELTALILLLTSNTFSQKFLWIWWKRIQRTSYIYIITWGIMAAQLFPWKVYPLLILWGVVFLIATWKNYKKSS